MKINNVHLYLQLFLLLIGIWGVQSCSSDDDSNGGKTTQVVSAVQLDSNGNLIDQRGELLYFSSADYDFYSNCTGGCLSGFALVEFEEGKMTIPSSVKSFVTFIPSNQTAGKYILTMHGRPLYVATNTPQFSSSRDWYIAKSYDVYISKKSIGGKEYYFLTDAVGRTLYKDTKEGNNQSSCISCVGDLFYVSPLETVPAILPISEFKEVLPRPDNSKQLSYNNFPLYRSNSDVDPGDTKSHGVGSIVVATIN